MMLKKNFLALFSKAINAYLALDTESKERLKLLTGKAITIELLPFHLCFQCFFTEQGVVIESNELFDTQTIIRGTPLQMLNVMMLKEQRQRFFAEDLTITGDAEFAQQVIALFDELQIDWEECLAKQIGDVPAYRVGRFIRHVGEWLQETNNKFTQNVHEFIHEEAEWLPCREALQDFFSDIDHLRMDVDRMEARITILRERLIKGQKK